MRSPVLPLLEARPFQAPGRFEYCGDDEPLHDYILERYEPLAPTGGRLRGVNLLYTSFAVAGVEEQGRALVTAVRDALGPFRTVWGVKHDETTGAVTGWELYFYDWNRAHDDIDIAHLTDIVSGLVSIEAVEPRRLPWHMFSIDFGVEALRFGRSASRGGSIHVYIDMRSYELRESSLLFQNIYSFHDPRAEIDDVLSRIGACAHYDLDAEPLHPLLPPELFRCHKMCVANKRESDAFYFSRVPTWALQRFLSSRGYPREMRELVADEADGFEHLLWDVGIDFQATADGARVRRSGLYGSF